MTESNPLLGLVWKPTMPALSSKTKCGSDSKLVKEAESCSLYKPTSQLVDGLLVPPNDPRKLNQLRKKQVKDTAGNNWFDMPAQSITPELEKDLMLLKMRGVMDPKRHYKKGDSKSKTLPKYFQVGTVVESPLEYFSGRLTNRERKQTIAEELLSDKTLTQYRKRKVAEIEEKNRPASNEKWKIKGQKSRKRAKDRRVF